MVGHTVVTKFFFPSLAVRNMEATADPLEFTALTMIIVYVQMQNVHINK